MNDRRPGPFAPIGRRARTVPVAEIALTLDGGAPPAASHAADATARPRERLIVKTS